MKKLFTLLFVALLSITFLTGCGSKDEDTKEETKTETKEEDDKKDNGSLVTDSMYCKSDDYNTEAYIYFKGDRIIKVEYNLILEDEEEANMYLNLYNSMLEEGMSTSIEGNVVKVVYAGKTVENEDFEGTKAEIKSELEADGYVCK